MPPEVVKKQRYTASVDIWSAGVLLYFITIGHLPFEGETLSNVFEKIVYSDPFIPPFITPGLSDLLKKMLTKQPEDRITIDKIKKHEWFPTADFLRIKKICGQISSQNINSIDDEIIEKMKEIGVDTQDLKQNLTLKISTDSTAVYHMLEREKLVESLKDDLKLIQCLRFEKIKKVSSVAINSFTSSNSNNNSNSNDGAITVRQFLSPKILSRNNSKLNIQKRFSHDIFHFSKNGNNKTGL